MLGKRLPIFAGVMRSWRWSLLGWAAALAAVPAIYAGFWPAMGGGEVMQELVSSMPESLVIAFGFDAMASAAGYLQAAVYGMCGLALLLVFAISAGARLIAGEEENGTLELELAHPVARRAVLGQRMGALAVSSALLVAVVAAVTMVMVTALALEITLSAVMATATGLFLLVLGFGLIALAVGAAMGRYRIAAGTAAGLAVASFIADAVAPLVTWGHWLEVISPISWYMGSDPLSTGWHLPGLGALAGISVVAIVVALVAFNRRDLGV
ncbi:MAG: ABC transporter permease subunit [Candidatus Bipolaricaulota bacterium]